MMQSTIEEAARATRQRAETTVEEMMQNTVEAAQAARQGAGVHRPFQLSQAESLAARREVEAARALERRAETESLAVRREDVPIDGRAAEELFNASVREVLTLVGSFPNPTTTVPVDDVVAANLPYSPGEVLGFTGVPRSTSEFTTGPGAFGSSRQRLFDSVMVLVAAESPFWEAGFSLVREVVPVPFMSDVQFCDNSGYVRLDSRRIREYD
jgi:hypothetical protein